MTSRALRRRTYLVLVATMLAVLMAACSSSGSGSGSGGSSSTSTGAGGGGSSAAGEVTSSASGGSVGLSGAALDALKAKVAQSVKIPTEIKSKSFESFTPKKDGYLYYITCDLSIVGCHQIADGVKAGTKAIGYKFSLCDAGTTSAKANTCFTNAINAHPDVIIVGGNGVSVAGAGYAAAKKAGIPLVGLFTSNPVGTTTAEVADTVCVGEGALMADAIIVDGDGHPNVLYAGESSQACDANRTKAFGSQFKKDCPGCPYTFLGFDYPTIQQSLPAQIQTALIHNPKLTHIVGVFDQAASIATTQIQQAGKASQIATAGMDGNPPNVQQIRQKHVQKFTLAVGQGEDGWTAVDAAARIYSGLKVPFNVPVNTVLITPDNVSQIDSNTNTWPGPAGYENQFKQLWNMG